MYTLVLIVYIHKVPVYEGSDKIKFTGLGMKPQRQMLSMQNKPEISLF